jgi:hypothetical protein
MSSTAERQRAYHSRSSGLQGARAKPQLLITTEVTPCQHEQLPSGSHATCASMCVWPSMKPGETISPSASSVRAAGVVTLPISTMRPSLMPISAEKARLAGAVDHGAAANDRIQCHLVLRRLARELEAAGLGRFRHNGIPTHGEAEFRQLTVALEELKGPGAWRQFPRLFERIFRVRRGADAKLDKARDNG